MMDLLIYLSVLVICFVDSDAGGHGGKHHVNLKIHLPEFIHHDHHKKVITIHHHHHKPKKEHHHHHHHHKPHTPHGHHYHHHHKKTATHSVSKGHSNHHGHNGHHGHHGHHQHHGHHHHGHKAHDTPIVFEPPTINYEPPEISYSPPSYDYTPTTYQHDFSYQPSIPNIPDSPRVHGVVHTVKQVKVFDSLPNPVPNIRNGNAYEVRERENDDDEEAFKGVDTPQAFPGTYSFVKSASPESDAFTNIPHHNSVQTNSNPFHNIQPMNYANLESFTSEQAGVPKDAPFPTGDVQSNGGFDDFTNVIGDIGSRALISSSGGFHDDTPVSFSRQAGIQETMNTEGLQSVSYSS